MSSARLARLVAVFAIVVSARTTGAQATSGTSPSPYIEASGTGQVRLAPDRATVRVGVETHAATAAAASAANAKIQHAVADTLRKMGFSPTAVTTERFGVLPDMETVNGLARRKGYVARYAMSVRLTALERIGDVIDAALARGANVAGDVSFAASNVDSAQQAAVAAAAAMAQRQGAALAASLGGSLGSLIQATTDPDDREILGYGGGAEGQAFGTGTSITPTQITVEATVRVRWYFIGR
jgi:uncharacterized protein